MPQGIKTTLDFLNTGRIINLPDGVDPQDAATVHQLATGAGTAVWGGITGSISDQTDLISGGKILPSLLPALAITDTNVVSSEAEMLALTAETGDIAVRTDETKTYILKGSDPSVLADWEFLPTPTGGVVSVFGRSGAVTAQSGDYSFSQISGVVGTSQGGAPAGGSTGYVLTKNSATDYDYGWAAAAGGLPSMTGNANKWLTNDGTNSIWSPLLFDAGAVLTIRDTTNVDSRTYGGLELFAEPPTPANYKYYYSPSITFKSAYYTSNHQIRLYAKDIGAYSVLRWEESKDDGVTWGGSDTYLEIYPGSSSSPGYLQIGYSGQYVKINTNSIYYNGTTVGQGLSKEGNRTQYYTNTTYSYGAGGQYYVNNFGGVWGVRNNYTGGQKMIGFSVSGEFQGLTEGTYGSYTSFRIETYETGTYGIAGPNYLMEVGTKVVGVAFNPKLVFTTDGKMGIGDTVNQPTSLLHLKGSDGSVNSTPLKLTVGTNVTTPEDGAFEYDGTHLYFTIGTTRNILI